MLGTVESIVLLTSCGWVSYAIAAGMTRNEAVSVRWCGTAIVACWLLLSSFFALIAAGLFKHWIAVPLWLLAALLTVWRAGPRTRALLRSDLAHVAHLTWTGRKSWMVLFWLPPALVLSLRIARGLVSPPLGWDALTYHLLKAGRWASLGGWVRDGAPDAWSYYQYFAPGGEILWAWAMLPVSSDTWIAAAGALVWCMALLAAYAAGRALGAERRAAALTALAISSMPCVLAFVSAAYVDTFLMAMLLGGTCFLLRAINHHRTTDAVLAVAAFSIAVLTKAAALPALTVVLLVLSFDVMRHADSPRRVLSALASLAAACSVAVPFYVDTFLQTGSPFYPVPIEVGGFEIFAGNEQFRLVHSGGTSPHPLAPDWWKFIRIIFYGGWLHLNFGLGGIMLVLLGVTGWMDSLRKRERRMGVFLLLALALPPVLGIASESMRAQIFMWNGVVARLFVFSLAAVALLGVHLSGVVANVVRGMAIAAGAWISLPRRVSDAEWTALGDLLPFALLGLVLFGIALGVARLKGRVGVGVAIGVLLAMQPVAFALEHVRAKHRYAIYEAASSNASFDPHPLDRNAKRAWRIWRYCDQDKPLRIAFVAGFQEPAGHNWYRYPLLGSRLQNEVIYVSPTGSGKVPSYRRMSALRPELDSKRWEERLLEQGVDFVVVAVPHTAEWSWLQRNRRLFLHIRELQTPEARVFRVQSRQ